MNQTVQSEDIDLYLWEGSSDLALRAERCLAETDITVIRIDPATALPPQRDPLRHAVALVSASVMGNTRFKGQDWIKANAVPVIWVASEERGHDPRFYPPTYAHTLPVGFSGAELRAMIWKLAGVSADMDRSAQSRRNQPLVAVSRVMRELLVDTEMYADCDASVLIHGETGVGKERIAQLLHDRSPFARGPFVAVNCGAVPEGLFEAHFFGHAKGAFTGAIGAHKGYFEQASGGTLFLDEIGDLPLYQQVKLLRVLEQSVVTRLGSTTEIPVRFRLVSASHRDLRQLVADGRFRADLYYRLAVIELDVPNLEERGPEEKQAIFQALIGRDLPHDVPPAPDWLLERIGATHFPGNIRELSNLVERIGVVVRQLGAWDTERLTQMLARMQVARPPAAAEAPDSGAGPAWNPSESAERERIVQALNANGWRRQDTAVDLGISRKVLWEKMRKFQISAQSENIDG